MAKIRVSDINKENIVSETEPKIISIAMCIEESDQGPDVDLVADLADDEYEIIQWILSDLENIKAVLASAKRRKAKLGKPKTPKPAGKENNA